MSKQDEYQFERAFDSIKDAQKAMRLGIPLNKLSKDGLITAYGLLTRFYKVMHACDFGACECQRKEVEKET